jgi:hypothetical protein
MRVEESMMNVELLKETIKQELPALLRTDPGLRVYLLDLIRDDYAGRAETQDRFYALLAELRREREERAREWDEYKPGAVQHPRHRPFRLHSKSSGLHPARLVTTPR